MLTCNALNPQLTLAATSRNLSIPQEMGLDVGVFCNGCYGYLRELAHLLHSNPAFQDIGDKANEALGREKFHGHLKIYHVQELWYRQLEKLTSLVKRPLNGLKIAAHYGCHYLANKDVAIDDAQIIQLIKLNQRQILLNSQAIWMCVSCHICEDRCPAKIKITSLMDTLRELACAESTTKSNEQIQFHKLYIKQVKAFGRSHESILTMALTMKGVPLPPLKLMKDLITRMRVDIKTRSK